MSFEQFEETKYTFVTETGTVNELAVVDVDNVVEVSNIRIEFYKHGTEVGDEQFRLNIYSDNTYSRAIATSNTVDMANITDLGTYWIGWLRFDFDPLPTLNPNSRYYIGLEPVTYTRVGDTFFVGANADWQENLNKIGSGVGARLEVYGREVLDVC